MAFTYEYLKQNNLIIFESLIGSKAYGTSLPESDIDTRYIYVLPIEHHLGIGEYVEQVNDIKNDCVGWEIKRFMELLLQQNPNCLELLWSPEDCIKITSPQFELIKANRDKFITKKCRNSFGGYAVQQIKKAKGLDKKMNWETQRVERKEIIDFCYIVPNREKVAIPVKKWLEREGKKQEFIGLSSIDHFKYGYAVFYDYISEIGSTNPRFEGKGYEYNGIYEPGVSNEVKLSSIPEYAIIEGIMYCNLEGYSSHCKDFTEYQTWLKNRNTQRYVDNKGHSQKIDGKNLMHCRRLLDMAMEIASSGHFSVRRPNKDYLLSIRRGEVNLDDIIIKAEQDIKKLDKMFEESLLPEDVDGDFVNDLLIQIRKM